jgi:hypothetical protein
VEEKQEKSRRGFHRKSGYFLLVQKGGLGRGRYEFFFRTPAFTQRKIRDPDPALNITSPDKVGSNTTYSRGFRGLKAEVLHAYYSPVFFSPSWPS